MKNKKLLLLLICSIALHIHCIAADIVKENRDVEKFNSIKVSSGVDVYFSQQNQQSIVVETEESLLKDIITEVKDSCLVIRREGDVFKKRKTLKVYVSTQDIENITLSGGADFYSDTLVCNASLAIKASCASDIHLGQLQVANDVDIVLSSGSDCHIKDLQAQNFNLKASGGSDTKANVNVSGNLSVELSGASDAKLKGKANNVNQVTCGNSDINIRKLSYNNINVLPEAEIDDVYK